MRRRRGRHIAPPPLNQEAADFALYLMAQIGRLDTRPGTIAAMQRGLDQAWDALEQIQENPGDGSSDGSNAG
jgi:hypothetical protein